MTVNQVRGTLRTLRLERGWSYDELAADIQRVNGDDRVSTATVRRFLAEDHQPTERIEYAIRLYVDRVKQVA